MSHEAYLRRCDKRRREIYAHLQQHGAAATALAYKISRQRVHQIKERIERDGEDPIRVSSATTRTSWCR
jgi:hypothetical protein